MRTLLLLTVLFLTTGCGALFGFPKSPYESMTPEQILASGKDKSAAINCTKVLYAGATLMNTSVNSDKGIPSGITVKDDCSVIVDTKPVPRALTPMQNAAERAPERVIVMPAPAMGIEVNEDCKITATNATLADIIRLSGEIEKCPK